ncbi:MAG: choice-of-anchor B family protein [Marinicellaceae bacterium]
MKLLLILLFLSFNAFSHPFTPCDEETGMADIYPCSKVDLMRRVHFEHMGGTVNSSGSDIWGWTDPDSNREYAIMTLDSGTSFVDVTDPKEPIYLGFLNTATTSTIWRDVKTYQNYAYIVSEANQHGLQVFDLTRLRNISNPPVQFTQDNRLTSFGSAHNIFINEDTGFAFVVGAQTCNGGLHMFDLSDPGNPTDSGCFSADGYTHDTQCVSYIGPDLEHNGKEICFNSNEDTVTVVDVTNKNSPIILSRTSYSNAQYTHQGWLTEDQRYFLMNDELDEQRLGHNTKTYIWDMLNIDSPQIIGFYSGPENSIDHNLYIKGNHAYLTNYTSGLSVVDITDIGNGNLNEVANFDTYVPNNNATFDGAWSNYPFFESGNVILSDSNSGLFILRPNTCPTPTSGQNIAAEAVADNSIRINWSQDLNGSESYSLFRSEGGCEANNFVKIADNITADEFTDSNVTGMVPVGYRISKSDNSSQCVYETSACVETQTTGMCTAAPDFSGINSVQSSNTSTCGIDLHWNSASSYCQSNVSYNVYKSADPSFEANKDTLVAADLTDTDWHDSSVIYNESVYYLVRAKDLNNQNQDNNVVKLSSKAEGVLSDGDWIDDAEVQNRGSNKNAFHVGWELTTQRQNTGERSYWSQANNSTCNDLITDTIKLTANENSVLSFWTAYDIEPGSDGGVVEISTDNNLWRSPIMNPNYPTVFNDSNDKCSYDAGTPSFSGTDLTWKKHSVDLSEYQGKEIKVRWNYSTDESNINEGWYLDDLKITHTQTAAACITAEIPSIQTGLWYDRNKNGHGFAIEPVGRDNLYYTLFYSYKDDGTPEWYSSLSTFENGTLNINSESNSLLRTNYNFSVDPAVNSPIVIDKSVGTNILSISFDSENAAQSEFCNGERGDILALASWQLGDQQDTWCIEPIVSVENTPSPNFGGTWWAGFQDAGWGLSVSFLNDTLIAIVYYYDNNGRPRWAIGQQNNFEIGNEINLDLFQTEGYARDAEAIELNNRAVGTLNLTLNSNTQNIETDGFLSIDVTYFGIEGGNWSRNNVPITLFTQPQ